MNWNAQELAYKLVSDAWKVCDLYIQKKHSRIRVGFNPNYGQYSTLPIQLCLIVCDFPFFIQERYRFSESSKFARFIEAQQAQCNTNRLDDTDHFHSPERTLVSQATDLALAVILAEILNVSDEQDRPNLLENAVSYAIETENGQRPPRTQAILLDPIPNPEDLNWERKLKPIDQLMHIGTLDNRARLRS